MPKGDRVQILTLPTTRSAWSSRVKLRAYPIRRRHPALFDEQADDLPFITRLSGA